MLLLSRVARAEEPAEPALAVRRLARLAGFLLVLHEAQWPHALARHGARGVAALQTAAGWGRGVDVAACASRGGRCTRHDACGVDLAVLGDVLLARGGARGGVAACLDAEEAVAGADKAGRRRGDGRLVAVHCVDDVGCVGVDGRGAAVRVSAAGGALGDGDAGRGGGVFVDARGGGALDGGRALLAGAGADDGFGALEEAGRLFVFFGGRGRGQVLVGVGLLVHVVAQDGFEALVGEEAADDLVCVGLVCRSDFW